MSQWAEIRGNMRPIQKSRRITRGKNKSRWEVRPAMTPMTLPTFVRMDPRPEVVRMGSAVLSGNVANLQHKDSPEFQRTLDKYKALRGECGHESGTGAAHGR